MKKSIKIILGIMILINAIALIFWMSITYITNYKKVIVDTANSLDGQYELELLAIGEPEWPFGSASGQLALREGKDKISQANFELRNDGGSISSGCWEVTWYETYVEVILSGEEQFDEKVTLYFDGSVDMQQITEKEDNYVAGEVLDESRVIQEQSFEAELNDWGEVRFVSYLPSDDIPMEDVSFVLTRDNRIIYHFPVYFENNSTENNGIGMFDSVEAVGIQDIDGDNTKDIIVILNYVTGAGPQGMMPRRNVRIFKAQDNDFVIQQALMDEIMKNIKTEDMSISAICDYVTLLETEEIYDGYSAIQQTYFADEEYGFTLSYSANGNSRVILKENKKYVEFLSYDRLSANNKCELYVLYRSMKAEDGSWQISEAEILDIYAYEMSTKDVVSSGKTSWPMTGNDKYREITGE